MELVIGKKFKFEVWEVIVQKMSLNEVAKFRVHKSVSIACCLFATHNMKLIDSFAVGCPVSLHSEDTAGRRTAERRAQALLWHDDTK